MADAKIDYKAAEELEERYDPEMQFRHTYALAKWLVIGLLFLLSLFHYYTAGFGVLVRETLTPLPKRYPGIVPGLVGLIIVIAGERLYGSQNFIRLRHDGTGVERHLQRHGPGIIVRKVLKHHGGKCLHSY